MIRWTPGLTLWVTFPTYPFRGAVEAGNYLYVVSGNTLYQVCYNGGYVNCGTIGSGAPTPVSMAINESQILIVDGTTGYVFDYYLISVGNPSQIATLISDATPLATITALTGNT